MPTSPYTIGGSSGGDSLGVWSETARYVWSTPADVQNQTVNSFSCGLDVTSAHKINLLYSNVTFLFRRWQSAPLLDLTKPQGFRYYDDEIIFLTFTDPANGVFDAYVSNGTSGTNRCKLLAIATLVKA